MLEKATDLQCLLACCIVIEVLSEMVLRKWKLSLTIFFQINLTSYSTTLRVISPGEGLGLNGFEEVCGPGEV